MAMGPIDYSSMLPQLDGNALMALSQQIHQNRVVAEKKQAAELARAQKTEHIRRLVDNPSRENMTAYQLMYPDDHDAAANAFKAYPEERQRQNLSDMGSVYAALQSNRPDFARNVLQSRQTALKSAGEDTTQTDQALALLDSNDPNDRKLLQGIALVGMGIATGPDKFESTVTGLRGDERESALLGGKVRKGEAEATTAEAVAGEAPAQQAAITEKAQADASTAQTTAQFAPDQQRATLRRNDAEIANIQSQVSERAARLDLDRDKLTSDVQLKLDEMDYDRTKLSDGQAAKVTDFVVAAEGGRAVAQRANNLAEQFAKSDGSSGGFTKFGDWIGANGQEAAALRREYKGIMGSQVVKNLPPGSASDTDIRLAMGGFPSPNAKPSTIAGFLRGMAKLQEAQANSDQAKADWTASNGSLGTAQRDIYVNGTRVPKGTTYGEFSKSRAAYERKEGGRATTDSRSYMKYAR